MRGKCKMAMFDFLNASKKNKDNNYLSNFEDTGYKGKEITRYEEISVDSIVPNPYKPRHTFEDETIKELAQSIKQVGLIQPLVVRKIGNRYELIAGERRLRAVRSLGMKKVACVVQVGTIDETSAMMALIENLQRENLHFLEEAQCYASLLSNYSLTQEELAYRLGKSQSFIANKLRVLKLSSAVKKAIIKYKISERHARSILKLRDEQQQLLVIKMISEKNMSVKETESQVNKILNDMYDKKTNGAKPRPVILRRVKDYKAFMNSINYAIDIMKQSGFGVDMVKNEHDDGIDIEIHIKNNKIVSHETF